MSCSSETLVKLDPTTKLRKLRPRERSKLSSLLLLNNSWQKLAGVIRDPDNPSHYLFSTDNISLLESQRFGRNPVEALLDHWSTYGQNQPDLNDLLMYLKEAELLRVACFVEVEILKNNMPSNAISSEELETIINNNRNIDLPPDVNDIDKILEEINFDGVTLYPYRELEVATKTFCELRIEQGGSKIGEGSYGVVFRGRISDEIVAVKKLKDNVDKQFFTELSILVRFKHENLLPLLGCSFNGPSCCLVYEYMDNGSLQERLACFGNTPHLSIEARLNIAYGSALGINHLHTFEEEPMVHRDIKSANILLDKNLVPKVGDFGLVRIGDSKASSTVAVTEHVIGTCVYMAREAFYGDVSIKWDTFSYGVVLLEILTALPPYDVNREDGDLVR